MPPCASLASCSGSARRPLDIAARLGGEEFAVLLYDSEEGNTLAIAERLRQAVEALGIEHLLQRRPLPDHQPGGGLFDLRHGPGRALS